MYHQYDSPSFNANLCCVYPNLTVVLSCNVHPQFFSHRPFHISAFHNNSFVWRIRVRAVSQFEFSEICQKERNLTRCMYFPFHWRNVMFHSLCSCLCRRCQIKEEEIGWIDVHTRADLMAVLLRWPKCRNNTVLLRWPKCWNNTKFLERKKLLFGRSKQIARTWDIKCRNSFGLLL